MRKGRVQKNIIIILMLFIVGSLSVAFSSFYQALEISGVVGVTSQASNWNISFDDVVSLNTSGYAVGNSASGTQKITFSCEFIAANDYCELVANIQNNGTINALYKNVELQVVQDGIVLQNSSNSYEDDVVTINLIPPEDWVEGETLLRTNDIGTFSINSSLKDISSLDESVKYTITVSFNFEQGENK